MGIVLCIRTQAVQRDCDVHLHGRIKVAFALMCLRSHALM